MGFMTLTSSSTRKEKYYYIPGGRVDDVCSILNVTYEKRQATGFMNKNPRESERRTKSFG